MPAPKPRCFVHIGPPKTGTSYLQSVLLASRDALASQGLELPLEKRDHYHLALAIRDIEKFTSPSGVATVLDRLSAAFTELAKADTDALITDEQLAPATPPQVDKLMQLLTDWEVHVIVTARGLSRQVPSAWQQSMKKWKTLGYAEFLEAVVHRQPAAAGFWSHQDLVNVTASWGTAVAPGRVHIVTVPQPGSAPTVLLNRFCSVLGVDPASLQTSVARTNTSLGHAQAELLRHVNAALGGDRTDPEGAAARAGQNYLAKQILVPQGGSPPQLPADLQQWCREVSQQTITTLRARGYDVVGDLAELLPNDISNGSAQITVSADEIVAVAAQALATLVTQRYEDAERLKRLRSRLRERGGRPSRRRPG